MSADIVNCVNLSQIVWRSYLMVYIISNASENSITSLSRTEREPIFDSYNVQ